MTQNNKGRDPGKDATPNSTHDQHDTKINPLIGWFNLAKPLLEREKRTGKKGGRK